MTSDQTDLAWFVVVATGRTSQPRRPLAPRTLLGSSGHCHLKFAEGLPPVHSVLQAGPDGLSIECLHESPEVLLDGEVVRNAVLLDEASLSVNGVELRFTLEPADAVADATPAAPSRNAPAASPLPSLLKPRRSVTGVLTRCLSKAAEPQAEVRRAA